jgi:hypothetical protein
MVAPAPDHAREGIARIRAARTRTGLYLAEMIELRRALAALTRQAKEIKEQS